MSLTYIHQLPAAAVAMLLNNDEGNLYFYVHLCATPETQLQQFLFTQNIDDNFDM